MSTPRMLVPCSVGGWRWIRYATQATGGVGWWFETDHPPGQMPTPHDNLIIRRLVEAQVAREQKKWRRAQDRRRAGSARRQRAL